ncbi:hypothetical protein [Candidatus Hydrogenosomobacter endosymbioticus]|uniref:Uncharacterized protein n=1 Tax=Candidatus Hydrogenosomobacter endosymbioticus TaxID=2558174 RepID=A0ABM7V9A7_9PROT|nr:hypothetical protein [Candidatus Hydrogenosomobacter endosymbioticus]BDB96385.1 hypothetical protein HYD_5180 [Candidatus Hydrogenosomobacter endosymbioticus]
MSKKVYLLIAIIALLYWCEGTSIAAGNEDEVNEQENKQSSVLKGVIGDAVKQISNELAHEITKPFSCPDIHVKCKNGEETTVHQYGIPCRPKKGTLEKAEKSCDSKGGLSGTTGGGDNKLHKGFLKTTKNAAKSAVSCPDGNVTCEDGTVIKVHQFGITCKPKDNDLSSARQKCNKSHGGISEEHFGKHFITHASKLFHKKSKNQKRDHANQEVVYEDESEDESQELISQQNQDSTQQQNISEKQPRHSKTSQQQNILEKQPRHPKTSQQQNILEKQPRHPKTSQQPPQIQEQNADQQSYQMEYQPLQIYPSAYPTLTAPQYPSIQNFDYPVYEQSSYEQQDHQYQTAEPQTVQQPKKKKKKNDLPTQQQQEETQSERVAPEYLQQNMVPQQGNTFITEQYRIVNQSPVKSSSIKRTRKKRKNSSRVNKNGVNKNSTNKKKTPRLKDGRKNKHDS